MGNSLSWNDYFMNIADMVSRKSSCSRRQVGAIIVKENRIVSTGYNGTPRGLTNCNQGGCARCAGNAEPGTKLDECLCCHAEENAIVQAAYHGVSVSSGMIYTTFSPCLTCAKMIINAGISTVRYREPYPSSDAALKLFASSGITGIMEV